MSPDPVLPDRAAAGRRLGTLLQELADEHPVVLGLPRGGVPVAAEVADALDAPLDVIVVRKLRAPARPELAMGAVGEGGVRVVNHDVVRALGVTSEVLGEAERRERAEVVRSAERWRAGRAPVPFEGRTVVVVDDGMATGSTAKAACALVRARGANRVVLAVPVAAESAVADLAAVVDEVVCLEMPQPFLAVGQGYGDFTPTSDAEVTALLAGRR